MSNATARLVAKELTAHDAFAAHIDAELKIDPEALTNPWHAALASAASFITGGVIPLLAVALPPAGLRIPVMLLAVIVALAITGALSAYAGGASKLTATLRVVIGGVLAMAITYGIGKLFGVIGL
jgi:VIT1/CCC1 family predicted Fe2+/Mn2+ transporter